MTRLNILEQDEIDSLYKIPRLSYAEKESFFVLTSEDTAYLNQNCSSISSKMNYILQLGYFRAVQYFFVFKIYKVKDDIKYILSRYFGEASVLIQDVSTRIHYQHQKNIERIYHFKKPTKFFLNQLRKHGQEKAKLDSRAKSILFELMNYCHQKQTIRPVYSTLQDIVGGILKKEKSRICYKLKVQLDKQTKVLLKNLLTTEGLFYKLTLLKKDPKDFSTREIQKELKKREYISDIFYKAETILPGIDISNQNIQYYASLAEFYDVSKLKRLNSGIVQLYLLCFSWFRFKEINDHLVAYFIYRTNYYIKEAALYSEKEICKAKLLYDKDRSKAGKILTILSDKKNEDHELRPKAYQIVAEDNFLRFVQRFKRPNFDTSFYIWQYYFKIRHKVKINLRPVFKVIEWNCEKKEALSIAVVFLKSYFGRSKTFKKYLKSDIPSGFFPKRLKKYLKQKK